MFTSESHNSQLSNRFLKTLCSFRSKNYFLLLNQNERTVENTVATIAIPMTIYISHSITSAKKIFPASAIVARFIFCDTVHECDSAFFHLSGQAVNL